MKARPLNLLLANPAVVAVLALAISGCPVPVEDDEVPVQVFDHCESRDFTLIDPVDGRAWTPNAITLVSEEAADGVFVVYDSDAATYEPAGFPLATSGGFVIGEEGVLIVETMVNRQLLCQVYDLLRAETDLPVLYAVNTSSHGDHSFGNSFLPDEVQLVQHERTAEIVATSFADEVAFIEANLGTDQGIDEATPVEPDIVVGDSGWSVDLGGISVEAQYHGFAQTGGDLFVYVPEAEVIWTGNALVASGAAIPWLLDGHAQDVQATLVAVQASLPIGAVVVPGHGGPTGPDSFSFSIDYLNTLITEVQISVDAGHDLETTQASVVMEDYQGYALWDYIHNWVNIPPTHAELGQ